MKRFFLLSNYLPIVKKIVEVVSYIIVGAILKQDEAINIHNSGETKCKSVWLHKRRESLTQTLRFVIVRVSFVHSRQLGAIDLSTVTGGVPRKLGRWIIDGLARDYICPRYCIISRWRRNCSNSLVNRADYTVN